MSTSTVPTAIELEIQQADQLWKAGQLDEAIAHLEKAVAAHPGQPQLHYHLALHHDRNDKTAAAEAHFRKAFELAPSHTHIRLGLAELLRKLARYDDMLRVLPHAPPTGVSQAHAVRWWKARGLALDAKGRTEEASACFSKAFALAPSDVQIANWLAIYAEDAGETASASTYRGVLAAQSSKHLAQPLKEMLAAIKVSPGLLARNKMAKDWAWSFKQTNYSREMWNEEIEWGVQADLLIKDVCRFAPDRHQEILDLVEQPDTTAVDRGLAKGRGALIYFAHVGPLYAGLTWLMHSRYKFKKLAFSGHEAAGEQSNGSSIVTGNNALTAARLLIKALREGCLVGHTVDTPFGNTVSLDFKGRQIRLSPSGPYFGYRGIPTFWAQPLWSDRRILFEVHGMPEPAPGEAEDDFSRRWYARALEHLDFSMRSDPRNLMCGTGVWTMEEPTYLLGSARRVAWQRRRTRVLSLSPSTR